MGPGKFFGGKLGPGIFLAANWTPANRAPEKNWRQIGPRKNFGAANWAPGNFVAENRAPVNLILGQFGTRTIIESEHFFLKENT